MTKGENLQSRAHCFRLRHTEPKEEKTGKERQDAGRVQMEIYC